MVCNRGHASWLYRLAHHACTVRSNLSLEAIHLFLLVAYSHHSLEFCIRAIDRVCYIITTKYTYTTYAQKINSLLKHCRQLFIPFWTEQQKPQNNYLLKKKKSHNISHPKWKNLRLKEKELNTAIECWEAAIVLAWTEGKYRRYTPL